MSKTIYLFDAKTKQFTGYQNIDDNTDVPTNATELPPKAADGSPLMQPITWDGNKWNGQTLDQFKTAAGGENTTPTADQQAQANILLQIANLQSSQATQEKTNANLILQLAQLQKGSN